MNWNSVTWDNFEIKDWVEHLQNHPLSIGDDDVYNALNALNSFEVAEILITDPELFSVLEGFESLDKTAWFQILKRTHKLNCEAIESDILREFSRREREDIIAHNLAFEDIFEKYPQ